MIIEVEDRYCKVIKVFSKALKKLDRAAERGDSVHEVEETAFGDLLETGRQMIAAYIQQQGKDVPRPKAIEHEGRKLRRLPRQRTRPYVSVFGPVPFRRDVYATRETQRQEVVPLDAKLGMPEGNTSYLLQKWSGTKCAKESYQESRATLREILGFAPSVNCLEDTVARAAEYADAYFAEQPPVDPANRRRTGHSQPTSHLRQRRLGDVPRRSNPSRTTQTVPLQTTLARHPKLRNLTRCGGCNHIVPDARLRQTLVCAQPARSG